MKNNIIKIIEWLAILMPLSVLAGRGVADANLSLIAVMFAIYELIYKERKWLTEKWVWAGLLLFGYLVCRSAFSSDPWLSLSKVLPWLRFILFAAALQFVAANQEKFYKRFTTCLLVVVCFLSADAIFQFFSGHDIFGRPYFDEGNGTVRLTGPYSKKVVGSVISLLSCPILALLYYRATNTTNKLQSSSCILMGLSIFLSVFLSGERSALLQITGSTLLIMALLIQNKKLLCSGIAFITLLVTVTAVLHPALFTRQIASVVTIANNFPESVYGKLWIAGLKMGISNYIFGIGPNHYEQLCPQYSDFCSYHSHNIYIEFFAETGLIGACGLCYLLFSILHKLWKNYRLMPISEERYFLAGCMISIAMRILPFLPSSGFFKNWYAVPLWLIIAAALSTKQNKHN